MNQEILNKWVAALRSGDYKQGYGLLYGNSRDNGPKGYCCLGVLCDVAAKEGLGKWDNGIFVMPNGGESADAVLPFAIADWAGLDRQNPSIDVPDELVSYIEDDFDWDDATLATVNDHGLNFNQIADIIQDQLA